MENLTKDERKALRKQEKQEWREKLEKEHLIERIKKISIWIGIGIFLVISFIAILNYSGSSTTTPNISNVPSVNGNDISYGPANASVTLIEYADFQCPACGAYHPLLKKLLADFNGKIRFVYRFFPLTTIHPHALEAAEAAYAAGLQGKFWQLHDMLYEKQSAWVDSNNVSPIFDSYAQALNLNIDKFKQDKNADSTRNAIMDEENKGVSIGIDSTPTFFINGKHISNPQSYQQFRDLISSQLHVK